MDQLNYRRSPAKKHLGPNRNPGCVNHCKASQGGLAEQFIKHFGVYLLVSPFSPQICMNLR